MASRTTLGPAVLSGEGTGRPEGRTRSSGSRALEKRGRQSPRGGLRGRQWWRQRAPGRREAEGRGSAQALVQVGRGEEGVGSQAHGQEASDQRGAERTFRKRGRDRSKAQGWEDEPVGGVPAPASRDTEWPGPALPWLLEASPPRETPTWGHLVKGPLPEGDSLLT